MTQRLLILGGTGDAAALAHRCIGMGGLTVISSLAGGRHLPCRAKSGSAASAGSKRWPIISTAKASMP
jgi:precorrin-6x reductase